MLAPGQPAAAAPARVDCAAEASGASAAASLARSCGGRVEVAAERSETNQTFANADGSFTTVASPAAVRARTGSGWKPVDTTLRRTADGAVAPAVVVEPLRLSGGGDGPLLTFGRAGARMSLSWPGRLPAPSLAGDTATYAEVLPGVDLQVVAGVTGYRQVLVVKSRAAAQNPALRAVRFGVSGDVRLRQGTRAGLDAVDDKGRLVFASSGASMWDSPAPIAGPAGADAARRAEARAASDGGEATPHRLVEMPVTVAAGSLTVTPDRAMLTAADTVYPVFIDPPFSKPSPTHWTNVMKSNPNHAYYGEYSDMRVGRQWQTSDVWRSHMQFTISEMASSQILSASMHITADHTADCAGTSIELWQTARMDWPSKYTWYNDSDGDWMSRVDTETFSANEDSCPKADDPGEFTGSLKTKLQTQATAKAATITFGLRATSESNHYEWTRFHSSSVSFQATYNRTPNTPTDMAISDCASRCTTTPVVGRKDPELSVFATDPDSGTVLTVYFEVQTSTGGLVASGVKTGYASGPSKPSQPAKWRVTPLLGNGYYKWRARSKDEQGAYSTWTGWRNFLTDTTAPLAPVIESTTNGVYQEDDGSGVSYGGIGIPGRAQVRVSSDTSYFMWSLDGSPYTTVNIASTDPPTCRLPCIPEEVYTGGLTFTFVPKKDLLRTLTVKSVKPNGMSSSSTWQFRVASPEPEAGHWKLDGSGTDDTDLITQPHHLDASAASWVQTRYAPEPTQSEYTRSAGARTFVPADTTVLALTGDDAVQQVDLPFPVRYYGDSYQQLWVDTNGRASFAELASSGANTAVPNIAAGGPALYPFWDNLVLDSQSSVRTAVTGTAPNRSFVLEWRNAGFASDSTKRVSFEAQLGENGTIVFAYAGIAAGDAVETGGSATVGVQNRVGLRGVQHSSGQQVLSSGNGVSFTPTGYLPPAYPEGYAEARFTGGNGLSTVGPVLATGVNSETSLRRSFAVAAWVRVTDVSSHRTAVAQHGANRSMFELGYQAGTVNRYCFSIFLADVAGSAATKACATAPVTVGEWAHLAGVYDGLAATMTLYVHYKDAEGFIDPARTEVVTLPYTSTWDATGTFTIGRALTAAPFVGDIDEVWAWQRAPEQSEVEFLAAD
ncbi:LamG domain-containing protein [Micromonospora sp. NPDC049836]|uniref:LamG domain-containing protein n=1 Tax=Micromonospora sp. NPDC049836 TaxID=3364274 RepID=UPI0037BBF4DB